MNVETKLSKELEQDKADRKALTKSALGLFAVVAAGVFGYYVGGAAGEILLRASRQIKM
jgi:hypothetical protein